MSEWIYHFYISCGKDKELCYNVGSYLELTEDEISKLEIFFKNKPTDSVFLENSTLNEEAVEIGPLPSRETSRCSQAVDLLNDCGFKSIFRVEVTRRAIVDNSQKYIEDECDVMTECVYDEKLETFKVEPKDDPLIIVPVIGDIDLIKQANIKYKMGMDSADENHFWRIFNEQLRRDMTEAEIHFLGEMISDHSRHRTFNATITIEGKKMPYTLMQLVKKPYELNPGNNVIAFNDNASAIKGKVAKLFIPKNPGWPSEFVEKNGILHPSLTVETHCYPTQISPREGAETGIGGDLRDDLAKGRGGNHLYAIAGFSMGNLWIPGFIQPWERLAPKFDSDSFASPLKIGLEAPWGTWDYGNKYGIPTLQGFFRTFGMNMPNGEHYAYWKPIMMAGMVGTVLDEHVIKGEAEKGMLICQTGGPAHKVGFKGGSGSSRGTDEKNKKLDHNAVQRGNAGMGHLTWRFIRSCVEMGIKTPIISIHDQGAAGIINVLTELIEKCGGKIDIDKVRIGDKSMKDLEILFCEYQERYGFLIHAKDLSVVQHISDREGCPLEVLGEVTGDGRVVFYSEKKGIDHINLPIKDFLSGIPQRIIKDNAPAYLGAPIKLPDDLNFDNALGRVLRLPAVACKDFLVNRVDRSIIGLQARGQSCGPLHLPISDFAMSSMDYEGSFGVASSIGEQPLMMMLDPKAGARMIATEMLLNLSSVKFTAIEDIKPSINWMCPAKGIPGGVAKLYYSMESLTDFLIDFLTGGNGGKDSSSLYTKINKKIVKSPETLVLTGEVRVDDISKFVTPDIKKPGKSKLILLDPTNGMCRLGGSAFLQVYGQPGDECPNVQSGALRMAILAEQEMIDRGIILSSHDRVGDGGLFVCLLEMLFGGDCGANINLYGADKYATLFSQEAGKVIEYDEDKEAEILKIIKSYNVPYRIIGQTTKDKTISIRYNNETIYSGSVVKLRQIWREHSYQMERMQINPECADEEFSVCREPKQPPYRLTFIPKPTLSSVLKSKKKPKVAVLRGKVTTGDREMARALYEAGHKPYDVHFSDLCSGRIKLDEFQGLTIAPGFSYEDVFGAGKGMAMRILYDSRLREQFTQFRNRDDTWFLGCCNGAQAGTWLGLAPFKELDYKKQPLFLRNKSGAFESRFVYLKVNPNSPSILSRGMEGSILGVWVAHQEGRVWLPDSKLISVIEEDNLVPFVYVDDEGNPTEKYPYNPNGSINGWASFCDKSGRFNVMMPHPERTFLKWQWPWMPDDWKNFEASPWLKIFQNAYDWCVSN